MVIMVIRCLVMNKMVAMNRIFPLRILVFLLFAIFTVGAAQAQISRLDKRFNIKKRNQQSVRKPVVRTTSQRTVTTSRTNNISNSNYTPPKSQEDGELPYYVHLDNLYDGGEVQMSRWLYNGIEDLLPLVKRKLSSKEYYEYLLKLVVEVQPMYRSAHDDENKVKAIRIAREMMLPLINDLPSLTEVMDPKYEGDPVYSLEKDDDSDIQYRYSFEALPAETPLLLSNDKIIVTCSRQQGSTMTRSYDKKHFSFYDSRTLLYKSSWIDDRTGVGGFYCFSCDKNKNQFYFSAKNGDWRKAYSDHYCYAYNWETSEYERSIIEKGGGQRSAADFEKSFRTKFKTKSFPQYLNFGNEPTLETWYTVAEFDKIVGHEWIDREKLLLDDLSDPRVLGKKDALVDLACRNFVQNDKFGNIKQVDFSSLRVEKTSDISGSSAEVKNTRDESSEVSNDLDASLIISQGKFTELGDTGRWKAHKLDERYYLIYDKNKRGIFDAGLGDEKIYLYDSTSAKLGTIPANIRNTEIAWFGPKVYSFGESDCDRYTVNIGYWHRNGSGWSGPSVLYDNQYGEEEIVFEGTKPHTVDGDINGKPLPIGFRVKLTPWKLNDPTLVGSLYSLWNKIQGGYGKSYWITVESGYCQLFLMDETRKTGKLVHQWGGAWEKDGTLPVWMPERRWMCLPKKDHCWDIYTISENYSTVEKLCSVYFGANNSFAITLQDGIYAGSPGCERLLTYKWENERIGMQALAPWRNRPAEVLEALGGNADDIAALRETTKRWLRKQGFNPENMPSEPSLKDFPAVDVHMPSLFSTTDTARFTVTAKATTNDIAKVIIRVDGVEVPQSWSRGLAIAASEQKELPVEVPLVSGQNWIEVTPVDSKGISGDTFRFRTIYRGNYPSDLFIVALGVSDYDNSDLQLQYAAKDAKDIAAAFEKYGTGRKHLLVLADKEVKDKSVLEKVKIFLSAASLEDRIVFYVAGHGILDDKYNYYYAPAGFDPERIDETGIAMDELTACLQSAKARKKLLLLDTCHSGMLGEAGEEKLTTSGVQLPHGVRAIRHRGMKVRKAIGALNTKQKKRYIEDLFSRGDVQRGINIIAGAAGAEYALESGAWKNGVFTSTIIQALQDSNADTNKDGRLNVEELQNYVTSKVAEQTNGEQKPSSVASENGYGFILCGKDIEIPAVTHTDSPSNSSHSDKATFSNGHNQSQLMNLINRYITARGDGNAYAIGDLYASQVKYKYSDYRVVSRDIVIRDILPWCKRWTMRNYELLAAGYNENSNTLQIIFRYSLKDTKGKTASGYTKEIWVLDSQGKIISWDEKLSKDGAPSLSSDYTRIQ